MLKNVRTLHLTQSFIPCYLCPRLYEKYVMNQLLHKITVEFQNFKNKENNTDVFLPTLDGNTIEAGINIFTATLFAENRNLTSEYTTINSIRENQWEIETDAPRVSFISFYINNELLFLEDDIYTAIPNYNENNSEHKEVLKELFTKGEITSFAVEQQNVISKYFGKTIKVKLNSNIINYNKIEAIPNEYVIGVELKNRKELTERERYVKRKIENSPCKTFEEAQQKLFTSFYLCGRANPKIIKSFSLDELGSSMELFIKSNNNALLAREIEIKEVKKKNFKL